ncbi:odorant receptor Or2-like [Wyeomyia smithii]|uniref:odorant receptor Or2-like n=1 Tax=Wyeomyia smithii TaxID=174621 RepID=UPI002467DA13|nr:odorant receptor Or2-like [Wyeomyia smithii]
MAPKSTKINSLNCPIVSINVHIWHFWSYIYRHDFRRYIGIVLGLLLNAFMFADLFMSGADFEQMIVNAFFAVLGFDVILRPISVVYTRDKFEQFLEKVSFKYKEMEKIEDHVVLGIISRLTKRARTLSIGNLAVSCTTAVCLIISPLFSSNRRMLFSMYIPGVNVSASPQYEILYALQAFWMCPACGMYVPFTNLFMSATIFGVIQMKTLQHQLTTLKDTVKNKDGKNLHNTVNRIIETHLRIKDYVFELNSLVTFICFFEFMTFGVLLCSLLFLLNTTANKSQVLVIVPYSVTIVTQVFAFYWHANEVREESIKIAEAAYNGPWMDKEESIKKKLLLVSLSAQRPLELTLGNVFPMTLEMFQSLMNASYSYCTLLRRFNN